MAILTGSKNALKGVGFLLGGVLLETVGFRTANLGMASALVGLLCAGLFMLPRAAGRSKSRISLRHLFAKDARVNWLSAARRFLFGSRDVWFVFARPIYLSVDLGWSFVEASGFLAAWTIGYGIVQALAPAYVGGKGEHRSAPTARRVMAWTALLVVPLGGIAGTLHFGLAPVPSILVGLGVFGAVFQWAGTGREGLVACLLASIGFVVASLILGRPLYAAEMRWQVRSGTSSHGSSSGPERLVLSCWLWNCISVSCARR